MKGRAAGIAVLLAVSTLAGLVAARVATHVYAFGEAFLPAAPLALPTLLQSVRDAPLTLDWGDARVRVAAAVTAAVPLLFALYSLGRGMRLKNEDTGGAYGSERLATAQEMSATLDRRRPYNNFVASRHSGIPVNNVDGRTSRIMFGMNQNMFCLGLSGTGKTYTLVLPDIMQSVGTALKPCTRRGVAALLENLLAGSEKLGVEEEIERARTTDRRRLKELESGGAGFDFVNTDPKGTTLYDTGPMLEAAGFDIKVVDILDFAGLRYNPFSPRYIRTTETDVVDAGDVAATVRAEGPTDAADPFAPLGEIELTDVAPGCMEARSEGLWGVEARLDLKSTVVDHVPDEDVRAMSDKELESAVDNAPEGKRAALVAELEARNAESGIRGAKQRERTETSALFRKQRQVRTSGSLVVRFKNRAAVPVSGRVEIVLPPETAMTGVGVATCGRVDASLGEDGETVVVWHVDDAAPAQDDAVYPERIELGVEVRRMVIPNGVDMVKTVSALVSNLKGTSSDSPANAKNDPFWDDTKLLFFTGLFALLVERYEPRYWTIPEMMRLLDAALPVTGDVSDPTPLSILIDEWETGRTANEERWIKVPGRRGAVRARRDVSTGSVPHDRSVSMAVHCYRAAMTGAEDTVRSVIITCHASLVSLVSPEVREFFSSDEVALDTLGDPGQRQAIFLIMDDQDNPFEFVAALFLQQVISICQRKAYVGYGGRLPRHVRLIIDEVANIGRIPSLSRAVGVVRSRNMSIAMYCQTRQELEKVYGEQPVANMINNCAVFSFLGAQDQKTLKEVSERIGKKTVATRVLQRNFGASGVSRASSESISMTGKDVMSAQEVARIENRKMLVFIRGRRAILDDKYVASEHPYYAYVNPGQRRGAFQPRCRFSRKFDYQAYLERRRRKEGVKT